MQAQDVKRKIDDALKRSAETEAGRISVSVVDGGKVVLNGQVHDWHERNTVGMGSLVGAWRQVGGEPPHDWMI
jgi:osmotically-inducible protein OsmY